MRGKWITADHRVLDITAMETDHIERCIAMLGREIKQAEQRVAFASTVNGELARELADEHAAEDMLQNYGRRLKQVELENELARRRNASLAP